MARGTMMQALIAGLKDSDCSFAANYPGTHSQDIFFGLGGDAISANEKVAFERAYGASIAGRRSVVSMKNVGLNTCADPYFHSIITGVNGGFVVVVTDDTKVLGSQEREDSRHFIDFFGGLWLEPNSVETAYSMGYEAFQLSEKLDVPVTIRLTSQFFTEKTGEYEQQPKVQFEGKVVHHPEKYIAYPTYWKRQSDNLAQKKKAISEYVESQYASASKRDTTDAVIVLGLCDEELETAGIEKNNSFNIAHYPLPNTAINAHVQGAASVAVYEQGDAYGLEKVLSYSNTPVFEVISNTGNSPDLPAQWKVWDHLEKLFISLKNTNPSFVLGDVGQYTVETQHIVDACLCLGSSVGVTSGVAEAGVEYPFCVVGDGAFLHSNLNALEEAKSRGVAFGIIVIDNGGSMATGGQPIIADIHSADRGVKIHELEYSNISADDIQKTLIEMKSSNALSILYIKLEMETV